MQQLIQLKNLILREKLVLIGLSLAIFISFLNALPNGFVSDDIGAIVENKNLGNLLFNARAHPTSFLESVTYNFFGLSAPFFHLNNIIIHLGVTFLVYGILLLITKNRRISGLTALLYAVHPIHTEAVTWISGLPYILYTFFGLVSLLLFIAIDQKKLGYLWLIPSLVFLWLSFYSSEKAIIFPVIIGLYFVLYSSIKRTFLVAIPLAIMTVLFALSLLGRFGSRVTSVNPPETGGTVVFNPIIQTPLALTSYIQLFFWPIPLTLYHETFFVTQVLQYAFITFLVLFLFACVFFFYKNKLIFFGLSIFFIGLVPTLLPIQISWIVAERYVYFSSLGLTIILAYVLFIISKKNENLFWVLFLTLMTVYSIRTIIRNSDWYSSDTLWPSTVSVSPFSSLAHNNMGDYYTRYGMPEKAREEFMKAIEIRPKYPEAYHNLANIYLANKDASRAAALYEQALRYNPNLVISLINISAAYIDMKNYEKARGYLEKAQQLDPISPFVYNAWGVYYFDLGQYRQSREVLEKAQSLDPNLAIIQDNLQRLNRLEKSQ